MQRGPERGMPKVQTLRRREAAKRVDLTFLNAASARRWDGHKSAKDVRVVLFDVSSLAGMAEEAIGKTHRLFINKADIMEHGVDRRMSRVQFFRRGEARARTFRRVPRTPRR